MTAARRIVTAGVAVLAILAGADGGRSTPTASSHAPGSTSSPADRAGGRVRRATSGRNSISAARTPATCRCFRTPCISQPTTARHGRELWRLDATGLPTMVADIILGAGSSSPNQLTVAGDTLYFTAYRLYWPGALALRWHRPALAGHRSQARNRQRCPLVPACAFGNQVGVPRQLTSAATSCSRSTAPT